MADFVALSNYATGLSWRNALNNIAKDAQSGIKVVADAASLSTIKYFGETNMAFAILEKKFYKYTSGSWVENTDIVTSDDLADAIAAALSDIPSNGDLSGYVTLSALTSTLTNYYTKAQVDSKIAAIPIGGGGGGGASVLQATHLNKVNGDKITIPLTSSRVVIQAFKVMPGDTTVNTVNTFSSGELSTVTPNTKVTMDGVLKLKLSYAKTISSVTLGTRKMVTVPIDMTGFVKFNGIGVTV